MPAQDNYSSYDRGLNAPAADAFAITPNDASDLSVAARALYIGGSGDVEVTTLGGTTLVFTGLSAGTVLPCSVRRVYAGNTTATDIIGFV
ncbi:MAG: hypothetical protein AAGF49_13695 [Pseudomonadota bacterium]